MGHYGEKPVGPGSGWRFGMEKMGDFRSTQMFRQSILLLVVVVQQLVKYSTQRLRKKPRYRPSQRFGKREAYIILG